MKKAILGASLAAALLLSGCAGTIGATQGANAAVAVTEGGIKLFIDSIARRAVDGQIAPGTAARAELQKMGERYTRLLIARGGVDLAAAASGIPVQAEVVLARQATDDAYSRAYDVLVVLAGRETVE